MLRRPKIRKQAKNFQQKLARVTRPTLLILGGLLVVYGIVANELMNRDIYITWGSKAFCIIMGLVAMSIAYIEDFWPPQ